jgi:predicted RNA-binding protein associated with RNAse of E/G family
MLRMRSGLSKERPVVERKTRFDGSVQEFTCRALVLEPGRRAVIRYDLDRYRKVGWMLFPKGGYTVGHFWVDRPYNVYHWMAAAGRTLAYYFNVGLVDEINETQVAWRDLIIDVLVKPDGAIDVLDEDELPADLPAEHRGTIARALEQIVTNPKRLVAEIERESRAAL